MRNKKVGRIKIKIDGKRMATKVWGAWSIKWAAICIAILTKRMAEEMERTPEYILQLATEVLSKERQCWDCDENGGEDE
jgi:hypothetical protein